MILGAAAYTTQSAVPSVVSTIEAGSPSSVITFFIVAATLERILRP